MLGTSTGGRGAVRVRPEADVRVEDTGTIREVILDRPSRKNALTIATYRALAAAFSDAAANGQLNVVILTSSGGPFSVGNDFSDLLEGSQGATDGEQFASTAGTFLRTLASFPKPVVAAVGGLAVGAGATILLHCDVVIAATTAAFEFPSTQLGILPDAGSSLLLATRVGFQRATEWLLFGDRVDVETAHRLGLVNAIVAREDLASAAMARAEALTRLPQGTVVEMKRLMREPLRAAVDAAIGRELDAMSASLTSRSP